ncbi:MAG: TonB family protein [Terriglobia bacterium]|jgi:protein TonB
MFAEALLESSPSRAPVLKKGHYFYATACGALASLACFFALGRLFPPTSIRAPAIQSLLFGGLVAAFALMLCYVYADSRQLALNTAFWVALTFVLNFAGFVCFLVYAAARTGDWKRAAIPCAYIGEVLLVGAMALVPLIYTEALPKAVWMEVLRAPSPPPPPPSFVGTQASRRATRGVSSDEILKAPPTIPPTIAQIHDEPLPPAQFPSTSIGVPGGMYDGQPDAGLDPVLRNILRNATPQPPPPETSKAAPPVRIRVGGIVSAARLIYEPKPEYPEIAKMTRTEGGVEFEAVIGKDGTIEELKVLRGHPLLVKAAFDAVRRWRYQPTLLNGEPIEVVTEITVNFKLAE